MSKLKEKDLSIYDIWQPTTNGNTFLKISDNYSIALGPIGHHEPNDWAFNTSQYVKSNNITSVKKIGKIVFY